VSGESTRADLHAGVQTVDRHRGARGRDRRHHVVDDPALQQPAGESLANIEALTP
jgi:hypothetical protein